MKCVIDRGKWWRGQGADGSALLRKDGNRCCPGFLGEVCGLSDEKALQALYPRNARVEGVEWPLALFGARSEYQDDTWEVFLAVSNDDPTIDEPTREARVTEGFAAIGVDIEFVDSLPPESGAE